MRHTHGDVCYMQHCEGRALTLALHQLPDSFSASDNPLTFATLSAASAGAGLSSCTIRELRNDTSALLNPEMSIFLISETHGDGKNVFQHWGDAVTTGHH